MSTPVKRVVQKVVSPISYKTPIRNTSNRLVLQANSTEAQKLLQQSPKQFLRVPSPNYKQNPLSLNNNKEELLINTPTKLGLLQKGVCFQDYLPVIGKGGFGTVIRAIYKGEKTAVKIVNRNNRNGEIQREMNAIGLHHRNVVIVKDVIFNTAETCAVIVMELCESENLAMVLKNSDLSEKMHVKFAIDIANGLSYCHRNLLLHLDVKPSNVLVCNDQTCKLCDFGNSYRIGGKIRHHFNGGTAIYAAPELLMGLIPTEKCDIYSLGVTFWQMEHRSLPYAELSNNEVIVYKVVKLHLRPEIDAMKSQSDFSKIYTSCWNAKPEQRPQLTEIIYDLLNIN